MSDIPVLKKLWCTAFPDDACGYCDFYFQNYFCPEKCIIVHNGKEIESAVYMFDAYYKTQSGEKLPFVFGFAGATFDKYKGSGNLMRMLKGIPDLRTDAQGLILVSAEELINLYDRSGFERTAVLHSYSVRDTDSSDKIIWEDCPYESFSVMREAYLDSLGNAFYWEEKTDKYMYRDIYTKGNVLKCRFEEKEYYAVCTKENDRYIIRETDFPLDKADILIETLSFHYSYSGIFDVYSHNDCFEYSGDHEHEEMYYGHYLLFRKMADKFRLSDSYINLIAD